MIGTIRIKEDSDKNTFLLGAEGRLMVGQTMNMSGEKKKLKVMDSFSARCTFLTFRP